MLRVKAFAPATVANLGVGFDILGLAIDQPGDYVSVETKPEAGVELVEIIGDEGRLSRDPQQNTATIAAQGVLTLAEATCGLRLWLEKGLPLASGMGSSAASAVAAAVATNEALGAPLSREDLLDPVLDAEAAVSGRHADNVGAALFGGIILITGSNPTDIHTLPLPDGVYFSLVTPRVEIKTAEARAILPTNIPLNVMVHQSAVVAELVHALHTGNIHLFARAMQRDAVVEPARASLVPYLSDAREEAVQSGALATVISGAGPTLCSLCVTLQDAEAVSRALVAFYEGQGIRALGHAGVPSAQGAYVVPADS